MATEIKLRRGTKAQHDDGSGFTGALGEVTVDTTDDTLRVHDGSLKGGHVIAKLSDVEASDTLAEMSDVNLTNPADGSLLKYDNASSKWIDSAKLTETAYGIDVTGTVTADAIKFTTDATDNAKIFTELAGTTTALVIQSLDDGDDSIVLRSHNSGVGSVDVLVATKTGIDVTGTVTADGVKLGDNEKIQLGDTANPDLEIYHNGSHSVIDVTGTGNLILTGSTVEVKNSDNNVKIVSEDGATGAVKLSHGNTQGEQLATTTTGINVTGELTADSIRMGTDQAITFNTDNSNYSQLKRTAAGNTFLTETGSGEMIVQGENLSLRNAASAVMYKHDANAAELYHRNGNNAGIKLQTTNTGIDVTGTVTADGLTLGAGEIATFNSGDGGNLQISGDATGSFSLIKQTAVGDLFIQAQNGHLRNDANKSLVAWDGVKAELYWRGASGAGAKLATTEAGVTVTGTVLADGVALGNNEKITLGGAAQPNLVIYESTAGHGVIAQNGAGDLIIQGANYEVRDDDENLRFKATTGATGAAYLYHGEDETNKLATTATGIDVTGTVTADGLDLGDTGVIRLGDQANGDLKIYHNGSHSYIADVGTGVLSIESNGENIALHDSANARNMARFTVGGAASLNWAGGTGTGTKLATTAAGVDVTGAVKSTKGFYTDYKNHGNFPTTDSWYTIAICKGRDAVTTIQRASGEFIVVDNDDAAGHETVRFTASELFAQDALISVSEYLSYSSTSINRFRIKSGNAFEGSALQVYASATTADLGVTLINDPYLQSNEGGWHLLDAPVIDSSDPSTGTGTDRTLGFTVGDDVNARAWDWTNFTSKADTGFLNNPTGLTTTSGVSVGGNLDVTGTVEADAFSGTSDTAITDFVTAVSTNDNDTTVPTTAAVKSYVDNNDGDTTYTGGTGLTLDGTTFNVDAAQTQITSVGTLSSLTTGATTVNGPLTATNDYHQFRSTNTASPNMPLIEVFRDKEITTSGTTPLGGFVFTGRNEDDRKVSYASFLCNSTGQNDDGEHKASLVFTVADGSGAVDPFTDYTNGSFQSGHSVALNIGAEYFITTGYLRSDVGELKLGARQAILESPDATNDQGSYDLHMPNSAKAKVMQIGGMGPFDGFIGANQSVAQMLQYRGQHMVASGGPFEFELPACVASSTISTSTANVGDIWQITNIYGSAITIDRDGSGTAQAVYYLPSLTLSAFTNNPTLAVGGTMTLQAVAENTWLIINYTGLTDA